MSRLYVIGMLAALTLVVACGDSTEPPQVSSDIRGVVLDAAGQAVDGATVVLQFESDVPVPTIADKPQTQIRYSLAEAGHVAVWVASYCDGDTLRLLVDEDRPAGILLFTWDGRDDEGRVAPDGVYRFHVVTADGETANEMLLMYLGYQNVAEDAVLRPVAVTDATGHFAMSQACRALGFVFHAVDELGTPIGDYEVSHTVRAWAVDPVTDARTAGDWVTVDPASGADMTVTLGP